MTDPLTPRDWLLGLTLAAAIMALCLLPYALGALPLGFAP